MTQVAIAEKDKLETWAILELLGHTRLAGFVTEEERFGAKIGRIDIPTPDGDMVTQYFSAASIYRLTPCEEAVARDAVKRAPAPVYHLRPSTPGITQNHDLDDVEDLDENDGDEIEF